MRINNRRAMFLWLLGILLCLAALQPASTAQMASKPAADGIVLSQSLLLTHSAGDSSVAHSPYAAPNDPDLCLPLPSGAGWSVGSRGGATNDCSARNDGTASTFRGVVDAQITKYPSTAAAHNAAQTEYSTLSVPSSPFNIQPATTYGDSGYAYHTTLKDPNDNLHPAGFFARACYYMIVSGSPPPASTQDMDNLLMSADSVLKQAPCAGGNGGNPTPAPTSAPDQRWHIKVTRLQNVQWFGMDVPASKPFGSSSSLTELKDGVELPDDYTYIETRGFRVTLTWERQNADGTTSSRVLVLGPEAQLQVNRTFPPDQRDRKNLTVVEILRGLVEFVLPPVEHESDYKFQASTHTIIAAEKGTDFTVGYDPKADASTVQLKEGIVDVTPVNTSLAGITLQAGQQVTVGSTSVSPVTPYVQIPGDPGVLFPETGKLATGIFMDYWGTHGGLPQQGYPISGLFQEKSDLNGQTYVVQYFERAVFEYHPEFAAPNDVLLSQLGTFMYKQKYPGGAPNQHADQTNGNFFNETGHWVGGKFWQYWQQHGGLAQQGYPLSDEFTEISQTDGRPYTVQYFERAVFESHPENAAPNDVLLSLLGDFFYSQKYGTGGGGGGNGGTRPATATPIQGGGPGPATPTPVQGGGGGGGGACSGIPAPINMTISPSNCGRVGTSFYFQGAGFQPNERVGVYATAPDGSVLGAPFQVTADQNGVTSGTNGVTLNTNSNTVPGLYAITMEGVNSHNKAIGYIKVLAP